MRAWKRAEMVERGMRGGLEVWGSGGWLLGRKGGGRGDVGGSRGGSLPVSQSAINLTLE